MSQACDVLALSPHPDDTELGCAAALALAARSGARVVVLSLTNGERASRGNPQLRREEAACADAILGVHERLWLGLPDTEIGAEPGHRMALIEAIRELRPAVLLAPWVGDRHPDHAATGRLAREAMELAAIKSIGRGAAFRPRHLFHYFIHDLAEASFILDATPVWALKLGAITAHRSQFDAAAPGPETRISRPDFLTGIEARARVWGQTIGTSYGEGLLAAGPVPLTALPGLSPAI